MTESTTISCSDLTHWSCRILMALDVPEPHARLVAESLVDANMRGVDSHGVHLLTYYADHLRRGLIDPKASGHVASESGACLVYDGEHALGQPVSATCCEHAVRLAGEHGLGMVVCRDSNHFGAAAFWGKRISAAGMIGIVMCNASPSVAPWQGREGRIGTNPICVSLPSTEKGGWLLDMATTTVAKNRIFRAIHNGETSIPAGWAMTSRGVPTTQAQDADLLMPLGGYKGSGLGLWVEIFCAVLSGGAMSTAVGGTYILDRPMNTSQMFLAIDVSRFATPAELQSRMESLLALVKTTATADGYDEVLVAGEPEERIEAERRDNGIPLDEGTWSRLTELTHELGIDSPSYSNFLRNS